MIERDLVCDVFGRRMSKTIGATTTQFLYDGLNPAQELDGATPPNVTANLMTGLAVDEYFARTDASGTSALLADALGSTIGLVTPGGAIATGLYLRAVRQRNRERGCQRQFVPVQRPRK